MIDLNERYKTGGKFAVGLSSEKFRENYEEIFMKQWQWIKVEKVRGEVRSSFCPITDQDILLGQNTLDMLCKESGVGKCAYCGDVSTESDTERKVQCFYPVVQNKKAWRPVRTNETN